VVDINKYKEKSQTDDKNHIYRIYISKIQENIVLRKLEVSRVNPVEYFISMIKEHRWKIDIVVYGWWDTYTLLLYFLDYRTKIGILLN